MCVVRALKERQGHGLAIWHEGNRSPELWEWVARGRGALRTLGNRQGPGERVGRGRLATG